ncbi:MAG TPA: hypothetical protein VJT15_12965 [Pyrinomonadaceae bacterium]|nr:hypothetical protein [Pyrinomonadaceae bacterium]
MRKLLVLTSIVICLAAFRAAEAQTVSEPVSLTCKTLLCAFAPLREVSSAQVRGVVLRSVPAKAQRRKETSETNSSCKKHRHLTELRSRNDPRLTNHATLTNAIAHELGHSFGLLDCYSCKDKSTVLNQFKSINTPNHISGPTACDTPVVVPKP